MIAYILLESDAKIELYVLLQTLQQQAHPVGLGDYQMHGYRKDGAQMHGYRKDGDQMHGYRKD